MRCFGVLCRVLCTCVVARRLDILIMVCFCSAFVLVLAFALSAVVP